MTRRRIAVGPETLTLRILTQLAADYQRIDAREAARLRLLAAIVQNSPNEYNLAAAGAAIRLGRARLTARTAPPPDRSSAVAVLPSNGNGGWPPQQ